MRKIIGFVALGAMVAAAPALAQSDNGREVVGRVLDALLGPAPAPASTNIPAQIVARMDEVLAHPRRDGDRARDQYRHPKETLEFFRVQPGMTVVDYMPAGGWFSRVLIPYLGEQGTYVGMNPEIPASDTGYFANMRDYDTKLPNEARNWVGFGGARVVGINTNEIPESLNGTADRVLIFRELHNMRRFGWLHNSLLAAHRLLKPDGLLGIEQHRAGPNAPFSYTDGSMGYQREQDVIALLGVYGFELVARSEVNANPRDPANWEGGVWTLPPAYRGVGPNDTARRAELDRIGESDRMTLLFRKRP
jgi:predicted methyltransferase